MKRYRVRWQSENWLLQLRRPLFLRMVAARIRDQLTLSPVSGRGFFLALRGTKHEQFVPQMSVDFRAI
jgi:hypothetical protein